ncbi:MAG: hypothetical protein JW910_20380 [Anaerolineae bacterium]|nr:hypothetical protein [Anaerolineae bacterium]
MTAPKDTIQVRVEYFTGQDEGDAGQPYYVASSDQLMFTTDGATFEALLANVRECLVLCLEDTDSLREYNVRPDAHCMIFPN